METKFRVYDKFQEKYIFIGFHVIGEITVFNGIDQEIQRTMKERKKKYGYNSTIEAWDDFIIEQYTGRKDNNKKEIYKGDIIQYKYSENEHRKMLVIFSKISYGFVGQVEKNPLVKDPVELTFPEMIRYAGEILIIGNINKNPELMC